MSFNEKLKGIPIKEVLIVIILAYFVIFPLKFLNIGGGVELTNLIIILYFIFKLRNYTSEFLAEISDIFSKISFFMHGADKGKRHALLRTHFPDADNNDQGEKLRREQQRGRRIHKRIFRSPPRRRSRQYGTHLDDFLSCMVC